MQVIKPFLNMVWNATLVSQSMESYSALNETDYFDNEGLGVLPPWVFHLFIPIYYSIVCISGLVGNGLVIFVLVRYPVMKVVPNVYILNLASADALFLMGLPFLAYFNTTGKWVFGDSMCRLIIVIDGMNMFTGIFTLTAMSIDRYVAIVHPVWSRRHRTVTKARIVCLVLWVLSAAATVPFWIYAGTLTFGDITVCNVMCPPSVQRIYIICTFIAGFGLPITIITIFYVQILAYLVTGTRHRRVRIGRVGVMILLAVALFLFCWVPFWTVQLMITLVKPENRTKSLKISYFFSPFLTYANSCLNPVVYTYVRQDFRQFFLKIFRGQTSIARRLESNGRSFNYSASNTQLQTPSQAIPSASNTAITLTLRSSVYNKPGDEELGKWSENINGSSDLEITM